MVVRNRGDVDEENLTLSLRIPSSLEILNFQDTQGYFNESGKWIIGDLPKNGVAKLNLYAKYHDEDEHFVSVEISHPDDNILNNSFTSVVNESQTYSENSTAINFSNDVLFYNLDNFLVIRAINSGDKPSKRLKIKISIPSSFNVINSFQSEGSFDTYSSEWVIDKLSPYVEEILILEVKPSETGEYILYGNLESEENDPLPDNNSFFEKIDVERATDLSISSSISDRSPYFGEDIFLKLNVKNNGPENLTQGSIKLYLPEFFTVEDYLCDGNFNPETDMWTFQNIENGNEKTLILKMFENELSLNAPEIINISSEISNSTPVDYYLPDNFSNISVRRGFLSRSDISLTVNVEKLILKPDDNEVFHIYLKNNGPDILFKSFVDLKIDGDISPIYSNFPFYFENGKYFFETGEIHVGEVIELFFSFKPATRKMYHYEIETFSPFLEDENIFNNKKYGKFVSF